MQAGNFLRSTSLLDDTFFEQSIIFLTEHNEKGAMGFVVNKLYPRVFNELEEFKNSLPFPLYEGGPVDGEHLFFIHQRPDLIKDSTLVAGNIYVGGNFKEAVKLINNKTITTKDIKLFIGYCGWDLHELEAEVTEGSWRVVTDASPF